MTTSLTLRPATDEDRSWASRGTCAQPDAPIDYWSTAGWKSAQLQTAVHICIEHCPVFEACHAEASALAGTDLAYRSMVAGGVVYGDRGGRARARYEPAESCHLCPGGTPLGRYCPRRDRSPCGTNAGYRRHLRLKQTSCLPCKVARRTYEKRLRRWKAIQAASGGPA